jgi:hypothetical protein
MALYGGSSSLVEMRGAVKDRKASISGDAVDRLINRKIRDVCLRRTWSDLTKFVTVPLANQTNEGTVSTTFGSSVITGSGTTWPVSDAVNTLSTAPVTQIGMVKITPASMAGIIAGKWLTLDIGNPTWTEAVAVAFVIPGSFYAVVKNVHSPNFQITQSSLAGLQFRTTYPFYTVTSVLSATELLLDSAWADITQSGSEYQIMTIYIQPDPYCWRVKQGWDPVQGIPLDVDSYSFDQVIAGDPQLTASDNPTILCPVPPGGGGVAQWMVYPPQAGQYYINLVISHVWPRLIADQDQAPRFINPDVFVIGAIAEALRTKTVTQNMPKDPYYDPDTSQVEQGIYERMIEQAEEADEARLPSRLLSYARTNAGWLSANYLISHVGAWPSDFGD